MARQRINSNAITGSVPKTDLTTRLAAVTTLITAATTAKGTVVTDRTSASETNATVGTAVTAVGTAITAVQTEVTAFAADAADPVVVDIDLAVVTNIDILNRHLAVIVAAARQLGLK